MELVEKLKLYCSINELGRISDTDFKGLVREALGLANKKRVSVTAKVRTEAYSKTSMYKTWLDRYFPKESTLVVDKPITKELPTIYIDKKESTEIPEKQVIKKEFHKKKPIV